MTRAELLVVGAGPAGMAAAATAAAHGLDVVLLDEQVQPGGQVYRALPESFTRRGARGADQADGDALRAELAASGARVAAGERVWNVAPGFRVETISRTRPATWHAPRVVLATGTTERHVPFPGWTLPGIVGLAAATILLKSQLVLPGRRLVVAGSGPLLAAVAIGALKGGAQVAAVVDAASPRDWIARVPRLAARPDLLLRGAAWVARLRLAGVDYFPCHAVVAARGAHEVAAVEIAALDRDGTPTSARRVIDGDSLAIGHGLVPNTDLTRLLGARHRYDRPRGGWVAERDSDLRTSIDGLYLAGDGGGISGAVAAELEGRLAALAALRDAGRIDATRHAGLVAAHRRHHARAARFGGAMAELMAARPALFRAIAPDCVVCRCEDVPRAEIDAAIDAGARDVNQLKAWTRAGMGPCQGKMCGEAIGELLAARVGSREQVGAFTARPPFRPLPTAALVGAFAYDDIPIPPPAPL